MGIMPFGHSVTDSCNHKQDDNLHTTIRVCVVIEIIVIKLKIDAGMFSILPVSTGGPHPVLSGQGRKCAWIDGEQDLYSAHAPTVRIIDSQIGIQPRSRKNDNESSDRVGCDCHHYSCVFYTTEYPGTCLQFSYPEIHIFSKLQPSPRIVKLL